MSEVRIEQTVTFRRSYKKLNTNQQNAVNVAIAKIVEDPQCGKEKKGDLVNVFVYKFKCVNQEFLLAYTWNPKTRCIIALGVHENFYRDLK